MTESFFDRLELELHAAAQRPPRRLAGGISGAAIAFAVAAAIAIAIIPAAVLLGGSEDRADILPAERTETVPGERTETERRMPPPAVGTVIPDGEGTPRRDGDHTVVATGTAPVSGPWQLETYKSWRLTDPETGEEYQPAGLPCLGVFLANPAPDTSQGGGGCGEFPRTPGFSRGQLTNSNRVGAEVREVLVYGRTPEAAAKVVLTADGGIRTEVEPFPGPEGVEGGFYLIPVKPGMENARVNWLDAEGNEGSRGIELLPPASGHVQR